MQVKSNITKFGEVTTGHWYLVIEENPFGYMIVDESGDSTYLSKRNVESFRMIDKPDVKDNKVTVNVWHKDVRNVAEWLYSHHYASIFASIDEAEESIYRTIYGVLKHQKEALEEDFNTDFAAQGGTAGYYVFFQWEDVDYADIRVYVDPSVAIGNRKGVHVVSEELDTLLEFYQDYGKI